IAKRRLARRSREESREVSGILEAAVLRDHGNAHARVEQTTLRLEQTSRVEQLERGAARHAQASLAQSLVADEQALGVFGNTQGPCERRFDQRAVTDRELRIGTARTRRIRLHFHLAA